MRAPEPVEFHHGVVVPSVGFVPEVDAAYLPVRAPFVILSVRVKKVFGGYAVAGDVNDEEAVPGLFQIGSQGRRLAGRAGKQDRFSLFQVLLDVPVGVAGVRLKVFAAVQELELRQGVQAHMADGKFPVRVPRHAVDHASLCKNMPGQDGEYASAGGVQAHGLVQRPGRVCPGLVKRLGGPCGRIQVRAGFGAEAAVDARFQINRGR